MAILHRFGSADDFDPSKMKARELAYVNTTNAIYKAGLYLCYAPGDVRRQTTEQDIMNILNTAPEAYSALQKLLNDLQSNPNELTNILNNITALQNGKLDKIGDAKDNTVTFTQAIADAELTTGSTFSVLLGLIKKKFADIVTSLNLKAPTSHTSTGTTYGLGSPTNYGHAKTINVLTQSTHTDGTALSAYQGYLLEQNKFAKVNIIQTDAVNDATKVPSSAVTYALGTEIDAINNNLTVLNINASITAIAPGTIVGGSVRMRYFNGLVSVTFSMSPSAYLGHDGFVKIAQLSTNRPLFNTPGLCLAYVSAPDATTRIVPTYITADGSVYIYDTTTTSNANYMLSFSYFTS